MTRSATAGEKPDPDEFWNLVKRGDPGECRPWLERLFHLDLAAHRRVELAVIRIHAGLVEGEPQLTEARP